VGDVSPADLGAWSELAANASSQNPFAAPEFVLPAAAGLSAADVGVLVVRDHGRWLAALPVRKHKRWHGIPGECLRSWRHLYCFSCTPLVSADATEAAVATLVRGGLTESPALVLEWIEADGPLSAATTAALEADARTVVLETFERGAFRCASQTGEPARATSGHQRRELQRRRRLLEREVGAIRLIDRGGDPAAPAEFLELEASGWKGRTGTAMACDRSHGMFFAQMCAGFASHGRLQLWSLASHDQTVAMMCNLVAGDATFGFKLAFDERFAKLSPGNQLMSGFMERLIDDDYSLLDSCADPDNSTVNRLCPDRVSLQTVVAVGRRRASVPAYAKWRAAAAALPVRRRSRASLRGVGTGPIHQRA
jgi:CelD/BcsL family acetyltransferase involved in cellulose biosynthesis